MVNEQRKARIDAVYARSKRLFREVPDLTVDDLDCLTETTSVVLVDVREEKEQDVSMIPGAVTARDFDRNRSQYAGRTVVAYCTVGHRSGLFIKKLLAQGWPAYNLKGAILAWTHADRDLVNSDGPTRQVHVSGPKWSLEAEGYEPIW